MMTGFYFPYDFNQVRHEIHGVPKRLANCGRYYKTKFTPEEDAMLIHLVSRFGTDAWKKIARLMETRNGRQCRERYNNYLNPNLNQSPWTPEEDQLLLAQFSYHGPKWNTIAKAFRNRSDMSLRNRWHKLDRRMKRSETFTDSPRPTDPLGPTIPMELAAPTAPSCALPPPVEDTATRTTPADLAPVPAANETMFGAFDVFDHELSIFDDPFNGWNCYY
jgi:hypothetical protein